MIDCHAHLSSQEVSVIVDELLRAKEAGIRAIVNICTNKEELKKALVLAQNTLSPKIYTAAATTPHDAAKEDQNFFLQIEKQALNKKLVAIGETGLDYFYEYAPKKEQEKVFRSYIELALKTCLPIVIHCRDAFDDLFAIFDSYEKIPKVMLHCFTGTLDEAKRALDRGYFISFSGIVTFNKSVELQKVCAYVPESALLLETDAPYLAPQGVRGEKNEPAFLMKTVEFVAKLRNCKPEKLIETVAQNANSIFNNV